MHGLPPNPSTHLYQRMANKSAFKAKASKLDNANLLSLRYVRRQTQAPYRLHYIGAAYKPEGIGHFVEFVQ